MNIKVEPFKNNIGASITCDLKLIEPNNINQIKVALNNFGFVYKVPKYEKIQDH